jgi:hypothetical protein
MNFSKIAVTLLFITTNIFGQVMVETSPPYNIKTLTFTQNTNNVIPIFQLGDSFQISFDDLFGNESDYYYTLTHCNYNWTPSDLSKNEYLDGIDNQRIITYENSFNTLQMFTHYELSFPNSLTKIIKSGNYILSIFNDSNELVFTRKFIVYENIAQIPIEIKRSRNVANIEWKQNLEFSIKTDQILFQNPVQNVKVVLFQNGKWDNAIVNIKPQYTIGNDLIFKYNKETEFFGGNEYLYFDTKEIRVVSNTIARIDSNGSLYNSHLYTDNSRKDKGYTYYPDIDGNFKVRNLNAQNNNTEADYSWVYFSLFSPTTPANTEIYVTGMFNNYLLNPENKMDFNPKTGVFEKAILIKQGFSNYNFTMLDANGNIDQANAIDGNYYQTENNYTIVGYYRANGERYDRVIGKGEANSINITN